MLQDDDAVGVRRLRGAERATPTSPERECELVAGVGSLVIA